MKKKTNKKPAKKAAKKAKKKSAKKNVDFKKAKEINFTHKKKTKDEIFFELVKHTTKPKYNRKGDFTGLEDTEFLIKAFKINKRTFNSWMKFGIPEKVSVTKKFQAAIEKLRKEYDLTITKLHTQFFDRNTFNFEAFKKFFAKRRMTGRLYGKSQIYAKMNSGYVIPEYNFAAIGNKLSEVVENLYHEIERIIKQWQSLNYFYFNFIVVQKYIQTEL